MRIRKTELRCGTSGQNLVEIILLMPLLLAVVLNAVNFGYLFLVALNLTAAPRSGVEYSILGFDTPSPLTQTPANPGPAGTSASVGYLTYQDMTGALWSPSTAATIQICSENLGQTGASPPTTKCVTCNSGTGTCNCSGSPTSCTGAAGSPLPDPDPEPSSFVLNRVAVTYIFPPLIDVPPFTVPVSLLPGYDSTTGKCCTFTRVAEMRAMN
jgi:hypothetical protein